METLCNQMWVFPNAQIKNNNCEEFCATSFIADLYFSHLLRVQTSLQTTCIRIKHINSWILVYLNNSVLIILLITACLFYCL